MNFKLNRESMMVIISAFALLIGSFYYGYQFLVKLLTTEAEEAEEYFEVKQLLLEEYTVNEENIEEYKSQHSTISSFLPVNA